MLIIINYYIFQREPYTASSVEDKSCGIVYLPVRPACPGAMVAGYRKLARNPFLKMRKSTTTI